MTWRCLNHLLLLVSLTLIHPSEEGCNENFDTENWSTPTSAPEPVALIRTNSSRDIMECSLERMCTEKHHIGEPPKVCYILTHCFGRPSVSQKSEKCKGEPYTRIKMLHFMCWLAKAANIEPTPDYCCDYGNLCHIYSEMSFPPRTDQTTLPPTTNATTTPPESTTITTTTAMLPPTTTTPPESTITTTSTTTLQTATTKTATKVPPIPTGNNSGQTSMRKSSQETENLTLKIVLVLSLIMNFAGPLLIYLYMRRRTGLMMQQNGVNEAWSQADTESQSNTNLANTTGNEEAFLMQPPSSSSQA
ncbi:uncharacterized protein LOC111566380 isoform X1 [Amphiprion ocellaris]|uniref:uncharacterized protein LOC111566380 isoform X1 n=1 Tax=Amphiprion ocellaris TaxID=80972 RepID=UPI002411407D|nr:uncharacterized protein LOC111566380 isoform X1 [Amphiprion ocellaris]